MVVGVSLRGMRVDGLLADSFNLLLLGSHRWISLACGACRTGVSMVSDPSRRPSPHHAYQ
jgi:hypothetical protein